MNNQFSIKVTTPCSENFNNFTVTQKGGFCGSCKKEVIDFTRMNPQEITNYFQTKATRNTCGRFKNNQLTSYKSTLHNRSKFDLMSRVGIAFLALFTFCKVQAQNVKNQTNKQDDLPIKSQEIGNDKYIEVTGTVTDNKGLPLPGVNVLLEGSTVGIQTNFDGTFGFPEKLKRGDVLIFSYLGFDSRKVPIQNKNSISKVDLKVDLGSMSYVLMGKVAAKKVYTSKKD